MKFCVHIVDCQISTFVANLFLYYNYKMLNGVRYKHKLHNKLESHSECKFKKIGSNPFLIVTITSITETINMLNGIKNICMDEFQ